MIIREAVPADAGAAIQHVKRLAEEPGINILLAPGEFDLTVEQEEAFIEEAAASGNSLFLVAELEGKLVGVLTCMGGKRQGNRHAGHLGVSVAAGHRGQGIGTALLERAVEWARANPVVRRVELHVFERNAAARRLYERMGFEVEGRRRRAAFRDGEYLDDYVMALLC
jgi:RimJ/RimL family protein N-acetyltransferase